MGKLDPEQLQWWLEWAGGRLMAMPSVGLRPADFHVAWPDYNLEKFQVLEFRGQMRISAMAPSAAEIPIMDQILSLPLADSDPKRRRVLQLRALVNPVTGRYIHQWLGIAKILESDRRQVKRWHEKGLSVVAENAPHDKVCLIGSFLAEWASAKIGA